MNIDKAKITKLKITVDLFMSGTCSPLDNCKMFFYGMPNERDNKTIEIKNGQECVVSK